MDGLSNNKDLSFISYCTYHLSSNASDRLITCSAITQKLLPGCSPIAPWSTKAVMSKFFLFSEESNLKIPSNIAFPATVTSSVNEPSKIILAEYPSGWHCSPNPPNFLPHLRSPERSPCPHTTSQMKNGPNQHFNLGLLYSDYPPYPPYENPPGFLNQVNKIWQWRRNKKRGWQKISNIILSSPQNINTTKQQQQQKKVKYNNYWNGILIYPAVV